MTSVRKPSSRVASSLRRFTLPIRSPSIASSPPPSIEKLLDALHVRLHEMLEMVDDPPKSKRKRKSKAKKKKS